VFSLLSEESKVEVQHKIIQMKEEILNAEAH